MSEMEYLRTKCGGSDAGQYAFIPHCTLLYNTSLHHDAAAAAAAGGGGGVDNKQIKKQQGESMLRQCLEQFHKQTTTIDICTDDDDDDDGQQHQTNNNEQLQLIPSSQYYFPYPKTADNGKGFGCCISLLILDTTPQLKLLHDIVRTMFPPDERHGDSNSDDCDNNKKRKKEDEEEPRFRPHMALIYASEGHENVINGWLEKYTVQNEEKKQYVKWIPQKQKGQTLDGWNAKYLSLWSTEGTLDEWYPIVKLDLATII